MQTGLEQPEWVASIPKVIDVLADYRPGKLRSRRLEISTCVFRLVPARRSGHIEKERFVVFRSHLCMREHPELSREI